MRRIVAIVVIAGLAAACGGPTATTSGRSLIAFSRCMRSHGVPAFPDPSSSGSLPKRSVQRLAGSPRFGSAQRACRRLAPGGVARQRVAAQGLQFARCVRAHGVPGFPDPDSTGRIPDPASAGIDQGSPRFRSANDACRAYRPPYMPSNAAYSEWARAHGS